MNVDRIAFVLPNSIFPAAVVAAPEIVTLGAPKMVTVPLKVKSLIL